MRCRAQLFEDLWRDDLMLAQLRTAMHHAVSNRDWVGVDMFADCRSQGTQRVTLRFVNLVSLQKRFSIRGANVQCSTVASNAFGTSGEHRLFVGNSAGSAAPVDTELQRRRAAVKDKDGTVSVMLS